jgi:hypothetical protein
MHFNYLRSNIGQQFRDIINQMNMSVEILTCAAFLAILSYCNDEKYLFVRPSYLGKEFIPSVVLFFCMMSIYKSQFNNNDDQQSMQHYIQAQHEFTKMQHYYDRLRVDILHFWKQKLISKSPPMFLKLRRLPTTNIWTKRRKKKRNKIKKKKQN